MARKLRPISSVGSGLVSAALAPDFTKPVPSRVDTAPGLQPASVELAALISDVMTGVLDRTSIITSSVAETSARLVTVNDTVCRPACNA